MSDDRSAHPPHPLFRMYVHKSTHAPKKTRVAAVVVLALARAPPHTHTHRTQSTFGLFHSEIASARDERAPIAPPGVDAIAIERSAHARTQSTTTTTTERRCGRGSAVSIQYRHTNTRVLRFMCQCECVCVHSHARVCV